MGVYNILFVGGLVLAIVFLILTIVLFFVLKIPKVIGDLSGATQRKSIEALKKAGTEAKSKDEAIHAKTSRITVRNAGDETNSLGKKGAQPKKTQQTNTPQGQTYYSEGTEVLGGETFDTGYGEATEVLGSNDEATDVLTASPSYGESDAATDVLTSNASADGEMATDVLTSNTGYDADAATDVLTSAMTSEAETDVLRGSGSVEKETEVLTSNMGAAGGFKPSSVYTGVDDNEPAGKKVDLGKITYVYNIVEVHTDEVL